MPGIYIHIPFCLKKCPYCDFYSLPDWDGDLLDRYTRAVMDTLAGWSRSVACSDTLYFGGGTPSLLGGRRIAAIIEAAAKYCGLAAGSEITLEANPAEDLAPTLTAFAAAGGNRLSLGMQSALDTELAALGRRHTADQTRRAVSAAAGAGIANLSLDLMLGIPGQTPASLENSIDEALALNPAHLSAYLLKCEPGTPFGQHPPAMPDGDAAADLYLAAVEQLAAAGYPQYEISNFARPGFESRHNLKYWNAEEYIGIGPAAHSFFAGTRSAYPRDLATFLSGGQPLPEPATDPPAGSEREYALLRLRLTEGLSAPRFTARFGHPPPEQWYQNAAKLPHEYVIVDKSGIRLTPAGFLVSNVLIPRILFD
ncbi:MAG: radical SAM family heme chaperone HemW [Oscillospiraceae bacterium]|nr:radical SAM family heme chaperone HemW [Oscillospiraceae bacterium]